MVYAVARTRAEGKDAIGYICVLNGPMRRSIHSWIERYQAADSVRVILPQLDDDQLAKLESEKSRNRKGNRQGADRENAFANYGRDLAEAALTDHVKRVEIGVVESLGYRFGIDWDFLGVLTPAKGI